MEGIAFSLRDISEVLGEMGLLRRRVYASGGGAVIDGWAQLRASIYGPPIMTPRQPDATSRGTFLLTAVGFGIFATPAEAQQTLPVQCPVSEPDSIAPAYETRYRPFRTLARPQAPWCATDPRTL